MKHFVLTENYDNNIVAIISGENPAKKIETAIKEHTNCKEVKITSEVTLKQDTFTVLFTADVCGEKQYYSLIRAEIY